MTKTKNLITTKELAKERGMALSYLKQIYVDNPGTKPKPVCFKLNTAYYDKDEMLIWLDNLRRQDVKQKLDKELAKRFLLGEFSHQLIRDSYQLKRIKAKQFPPKRNERIHIEHPLDR